MVGTLFLLTKKTRKRWPVIRHLFLPPTKISTPKNKQTWSPSFKPKSKWATEKKWNGKTQQHFTTFLMWWVHMPWKWGMCFVLSHEFSHLCNPAQQPNLQFSVWLFQSLDLNLGVPFWKHRWLWGFNKTLHTPFFRCFHLKLPCMERYTYETMHCLTGNLYFSLISIPIFKS